MLRQIQQANAEEIYKVEYKDPVAFRLHVESLVTLCRQANRMHEYDSLESSRSSRSLFDWLQPPVSLTVDVVMVIQVKEPQLVGFFSVQPSMYKGAILGKSPRSRLDLTYLA